MIFGFLVQDLTFHFNRSSEPLVKSTKYSNKTMDINRFSCAKSVSHLHVGRNKMTTETTALLVSILSIGVAGTSLGWNIYRDIILKPRVRIHCGVKLMFDADSGLNNEQFFTEGCGTMIDGDDGVRLLPATRFIEAELSDSDLSRTPSRPWSLRLRPSGRPRSCAQHTPSPRRCPGGRSPSPYLDKM